MRKKITTVLVALLSGSVAWAQSLQPSTSQGTVAKSSEASHSGTIQLAPANKYSVAPKDVETYVRGNSSHARVSTTAERTSAVSAKPERISASVSYPNDTYIEGIFDNRTKTQTDDHKVGQAFSFYANEKTQFYHELEGKTLPVGGLGTQYSYVRVGDKWYVMGSNHIDVVDAKTGEVVKSADTNVGSAARGDCYNPYTGKIYVINWDGIVEVDPETLEGTVLGSSSGFCLALAPAKDGLYYLTYDGSLKKFDLTTHESTVVMDNAKPLNAATGKRQAFGNQGQSLALDPATGKLYYNYTDGSFNTYMAQIDPAANTSTLLFQSPGSDFLMAGMYIPYVKSGAPTSVTNISYADGKLNFTVPTTVVDDSDAVLSGSLTAYVTVDNEAVDSFAVTAGESVSHALTLADGAHSVAIQVANSVDKSQVRVLKLYAGEDVPQKPQNLTLDANDGKNLNLTWSAPEQGVNGGPVPDDNINYDITRYPDAKVVAANYKSTTFSEPIPEEHQRYYYVVTAKNGDRAGQSATSNILPAGKIWFPPYKEEFRTQADFDFFTVIDGNKDGNTWKFMQPGNQEDLGEAYMLGNGVTNPETGEVATYDNDYLVSPAIRLKAGNDYRLSFDIGDLWLPEKMEVLLGTSTDTLTATTTLLPTFSVTSDGSFTKIFNVPSDGDYYLFFHGNTVGNSVNIALDNVSVDLYSNFQGPDSVKQLTAKAGALGKLENTISFVTPTTTYHGATLDKLTSVDIYRDDVKTPVYTFNAPAVGTQLTWTDTDVTNGMHTYRILPFNANGQGREALVSNWVGLDIPANVTNVKAVMDSTYHPVVTWDKATAVGSHGGYVNPDDVKYVLKRYNEYNYDDHWELATDSTSALTLTDTNVTPYSQQYYTYIVVAANAAGANDGAQFGIVLGEPYALPYTESFAGGYVQHDPWTLFADSYNYAWSQVTGSGLTVKPYDGDNGMLQFKYIDDSSNKQVLAGPRISLASTTSPELSFYMYHGFEAEEGDLTLDVYTNYQDEGWTLHKAVLDYNNGTDGWSRYSMPLRNDAKDVQIAFAATATGAVANIYIDAIKVDESTAKDLAVENISIDKRVDAGKASKVKVSVSNYGTDVAKTYKVNLLRDSVVYASQNGVELKENDTHTFTFDIPTTIEDASKQYKFQAVVALEGDANTANDSSSVVKLFVHGSSLPAAQDLTGTTTNGTVKLTWKAPATNEVPDAVTDGFDDYDDFIITGFGDWTTYDGDDAPTIGFSGVNYANLYGKIAWQVWNPVAAGFNINKFDVLTAHSGSKYLTCWAATDGVSTTLPNDDWLISSDIKGGTDLDFYVRVPNSGVDANVFEILYTTKNSVAPEDYVVLDKDSVGGTTAWQHFQYSLPKDATHFAIRGCTNSSNYVVMFLDDVTYTPLNSSVSKVTLNGYNIYRDGVLLTQVGSTQLAYTDPTAGDESHSYVVSAVYTEGESDGTDPYLSDTFTDIQSVSALAGNSPVKVYDLSGRVVYEGVLSGSARQSLHRGVYIIGGKSMRNQKVIVK